MTLRPFRPGDHVAIAEIFPAAVHQIASEVYTEEQCLAWSGREPNPEHWRKRCELKRPWVAVVESRVAGFLELDPDGHIDCAYVHPEFQRQGIMSRLVEHAVATCFAAGIDRIYVDASICAKPMFERCGFRVTEEREIRIQGVGLLNFHMEKRR